MSRTEAGDQGAWLVSLVISTAGGATIERLLTQSSAHARRAATRDWAF